MDNRSERRLVFAHCRSCASSRLFVRVCEERYNGTAYDSVSGAAEATDRDIRGEDASTYNGWTWWKFQNNFGDWVSIDTLREQ